jgi:hypothetical protein
MMKRVILLSLFLTINAQGQDALFIGGVDVPPLFK